MRDVTSLSRSLACALFTLSATSAFAAGPKRRRVISGLAKREATERARLESWVAGVAHEAVRWAEQTWRAVEGPPAILRLPAK
jgi:hypothetical protein